MQHGQKAKWLSVLAGSALLVSACSNGNEGKGAANASPSASPEATASQSSQASPQTQPADTLKGNIRISLRGQSAEVWGKVAASYEALHPGVKVNVDIKPAEGYRDWLQAQYAAGVPEADFVQTNENADLTEAQKFVDFKPWLEKENPYTNKAWKDSFNLAGMGINLEDPKLDVIQSLSYESVQILWMYNKELFAKAGITETPKTFNELIDIYKKLQASGITPFAIGANALSLWSGQAGWLMRIYPDQYFRNYIELVRSQPQDYTYLPDIDDKWSYDAADSYNDAKVNVSTNELRMLKAVKDHTGPYKLEGNPAWREVFENLRTLFGYAPEGFLGMTEDQAYKLFLTGKAATMVALPSSYWQLPKDFADAQSTSDKAGIKPFEFGYFGMPSMEGPNVQAPARTIHIYTGAYGFVKKDAEQTALDMDFMMYLTSPQGYKVYLEAVQNSKDASLSGAPLLNDIELPDEMKKAFSSFEAIGNSEGLPSPGNVLSRGLYDYQPSVQSFVGLISKYFYNKITVDEFLTQYQADIDKKFPEMMKQYKKEMSDLDNPERKPPVRE
ncbi:ABC transporter substrate-binding protein [Cohnella hashimotonis]|uniref:ABC transporter substrate-binding protein n=1 Tax=Cohnella hashimotonis TaxID=2826895 RepID=A0ABT6TMC2_9BACL|nr:ABC transporter substrate-binding protein [Cohnella hashimotonis]